MTTVNILIVDDQREVRRMLRAALESLSPDIQIQDIPSAEEALYLLSRQSFHLLVADIRLAGMSGIELVEKVRQVQHGTKIIVITGLTDENILQSIEQALIEAWFPKPVDISAFLQCAVELLKLKPSETSPASSIEPTIHTARKPSEVQSPAKVEIPPNHTDLESWKQQLQLACLLELDRHGLLIRQAGKIPDGWKVNALYQFFMEAESAIHAIQDRFGGQNIHPLIPYQAGLFIAGYLPLEETILIFIAKYDPEPLHLTSPHSSVITLTDKLAQLIHLHATPASTSVVSDLSQNPFQGIDTPPDPALESLLANKEKPTTANSDPDEFWDRADSTTHLSEDINQKTLDYIEARRLGLTNEPIQRI